MAQLQVEVRPVARHSLLLLERYLPYGPPEKHAERLKRQEKGEVLYLIAWSDGKPVGHSLLKWRGAVEDHLASRLQESCPDIEDLLVHEQYRSQGVGTQLVREAERLAVEKGFRKIGLGVGVHNERARKLYERLGFQPLGLPPHEERGEYVDQNGRSASWVEVCIYMVKPLDEKGDRAL